MLVRIMKHDPQEVTLKCPSNGSVFILHVSGLWEACNSYHLDWNLQKFLDNDLACTGLLFAFLQAGIFPAECSVVIFKHGIYIQNRVENYQCT